MECKAMTKLTKAERQTMEDFKKLLPKLGWKPLETKDGCAWFGGKSHYTLADHLPKDCASNLEDIDFLVMGWRR